MERKRIRATVFLGVLTCSAASSLPYVASEDKLESGPSPVSQVLARERAGDTVDRREQLKNIDSDEAHWQAGEVQRNGLWLAADQLNQLSDREREYEQLRAKLEGDIDSHRKLAKWCQRNRLPMQARSHWNAVIEKLPNDLEARRQLGHQFINDAWFTEQEISSAAQRSRQLIADLKKWNPAVQNIIRTLTKGDSSEKQAAIRKLNKIDDQDSVASLELAALQTDDDVAKLIVDRISQLRSRPACLALTRIALADPHSARGAYATKKLKEYDQTFMVPELMGLLSTPVETRLQHGFNQRGELILDRILFRETKERRELIQLQRVVRTNEVGQNIHNIQSNIVNLGSTQSRRGTTGTASSDTQTLIDEQAASSLAADEQAQFERELTEANRREEAKSRDVRYLLSEITSQPAEMSVEQWWKWWQARNYRPSSQQSKPLLARKYQQVDQPQLTVNSYSNGIVTAMDCLVAGTLVQTSTGNRPIESIGCGDLVLSQDVESGKLDLKPVVRVVPRDPGIIVVIETEGDEIRSTQGHRWWVSGKGWVMAADLEPGMNLHTASGTVRIKAVREDGEKPTFNLVVDEYHTYFVGKDRVLSFDNVEPVPTLRKVPGY